MISIETDPNSKKIFLSTWVSYLEIDREEKILSSKKITDSDLVCDKNGNVL